MTFQYDSNSVPVSFTIDDNVFYYFTNQMGDVIGIADSQGKIFARYSYDAWGEDTGSSTTSYSAGLTYTVSAEDVANLNPLRYRGYYFENDLDMYYLQSRYYMPYLYRFLNADDPQYAKVGKDDTAGINLFAYCNNDPVNNSDPTGFKKKKTINWDKEFSKIGIISDVYSVISVIGTLAFKGTPLGTAISIVSAVVSVSSNLADYVSKVKSAKKYYGKKSNRFKRILKYNSVILGINITIAIASTILGYSLGKTFLKKYSVTIAYALIKMRTITICQIPINVCSLLTGKGGVYICRSRS